MAMNCRTGLLDINKNPLVVSPLVINDVGRNSPVPPVKTAFMLLSGGEFLLLNGNNLLLLEE